MKKTEALQHAIAFQNHARVKSICDQIKAEYGPLVVDVSHDDDPQDPCDGDGWQVYSFSRRHRNYVEPNDLGLDTGDDGTDCPALTAKLESGLAFPLSYFEHGLCRWSLQGRGPQCRWDTVQLAGLLVWEGSEDDIGAKTVEDRRQDAACFMDSYTQWCNGEVYAFNIVNGEDACCGFYDLADMFGQIKEAVGDRPVEWTGDMAGFVSDYWEGSNEAV